MRLYLSPKSKAYDAVAEYDVINKRFIVLKGSRVSKNVSKSKSFKGCNIVIMKRREKYTRDNIVIQDVEFTSPSTAANFITGQSTNGLIKWKTSEGISIKEALQSGNE